MCRYCEGSWINDINSNDNLDPIDGGALYLDTDAKSPEDVYLYREIASRFSWASLSTAEELGCDESDLAIVFTVDDDDDDSDATFVSVGFLIYYCPWCGRDLGVERAKSVNASTRE